MVGKLRTVVIDCPDPHALAAFYSELLGLPVTQDEEDDWVVIGAGDQPRVAFQQAPGLREPRWPDPERPQQLHLDVTVEDIETAEAQALKLGATRLAVGDGNFRVYADPTGHPFCLCWDD